jgi:branched-subunit amino acid transport protein AzlD
MITLILIIVGFFIGRLLGYIIYKNTNWVNAHKEVDDYMTKNYGDEWTKLNK